MSLCNIFPASFLFDFKAERFLPQYMSALLGSQSMFEEDIQIIMMYSNEATRTIQSDDKKKPATQSEVGRTRSFSQLLR